jgi:hypothetical protein
MGLKEIGYEIVELIHLAQDKNQVASVCEHSNKPLVSTKAQIMKPLINKFCCSTIK